MDGKGGRGVKKNHSTLKYSDFFIAQNIPGNVIGFIGDPPLEGRTWIFKIPRDKPWACPEIKLLRNPSQEKNCHDMWDITVRTKLTTVHFPRMTVV